MKKIFYTIALILLSTMYAQDAYMHLSHSGISPSSTLTVIPNQEITFEHGGGGSHPMTSGQGNTNSPIFFPTVIVTSGNPIAVFSLTEIGTYIFHCGTNPGNTSLWGTIIVEEDEEEIILGDLNGDGTINIQDIILEISYVMGNLPDIDWFDQGDMNSDGIINILDVVLIVNLILGN
jgi:plastocyanin